MGGYGSWLWNSQPSSQTEAAAIHQTMSFWSDPKDILDDFDLYEAFWIKPYGCVWSECAVDDTDDGYTGDNRDGDSEWYQYRTQAFCANAAYELYGRLKTESVVGSLSRCSQGHYLDSFFTYGGADNLLKAIGETPIVYYGDGSNDMCVEIDYTADASNNANNDENNKNNNNNKNNENQNKAYYSSSLGCDPEGNYMIAAFKSESCDGKYFLESLDVFDAYNEQHSSLGCHKIYHADKFGSEEDVQSLLMNSWSCDVNLYPNGCPDPFGEKKRQNFALQTAANRGNAQWAYRNASANRPLQLTTKVFVGLSLLVVGFAYFLKNHSRIGDKGKGIRGYLRCVGEDIWLIFSSFWKSIVRRLQGSKRVNAAMMNFQNQLEGPKKGSDDDHDDSKKSSRSVDYAHDDFAVDNKRVPSTDAAAATASDGYLALSEELEAAAAARRTKKEDPPPANSGYALAQDPKAEAAARASPTNMNAQEAAETEEKRMVL